MKKNENERLRKKFKDIEVIINSDVVSINQLSKFEKFLLGIVENVDGPLFTILSGLITSLSVNLLTNFVEIEYYKSNSFIVLALLKLISCLVFNLAFVLFTLKSISIKNGIVIQYDLIPKKREQDQCEQLLYSVYSNRMTLKTNFVLSIVCGILTLSCIIYSPFIK